MSLPPHDAHCPTDPARPRPVGFCDRCCQKWYLDILQWQMVWAGPAIANTFWLVCPTCLDVLNEQGRTIVIGPDPLPLQNPRPGFQAGQENTGGGPPYPVPVPAFVDDGIL